MKLLVTAAQGAIRALHFPELVVRGLEGLGDVAWNPHTRPYTPAELAQALADVEVLVTHWGTPQISAELLASAPRLRLIAHAAGSVARIASEAVYDCGIPVLSANSVMAQYVAEGVLCYLLMALREAPRHDAQLKAGVLWERRMDRLRSLFGASIGLVGLGAVGRRLLDLLVPFGCSVVVYDPYLPADALSPWPFARQVETLAEAMARPIVSVHAAQTPETRHMIGAKQLALMPEGGLLVNTARGSLVEERAMVAELMRGRLSAVLDVFEREPLPLDHPYRRCPNVLLQPHMAAAPGHWQLSQAIVEDIARWQRGEAPQLTIPRAQFRLMTQE